MRSRNLTSFSAKKCLTATEICAIIQTCGESGVKELKYFDLHVTLAGQRCNDEDHLHHSPGQAWNPTEEKKNIAEDGLNLQEDEFAELQIQDPVSYEQLLATKDFMK